MKRSGHTITKPDLSRGLDSWGLVAEVYRRYWLLNGPPDDAPSFALDISFPRGLFYIRRSRAKAIAARARRMIKK